MGGVSQGSVFINSTRFRRSTLAWRRTLAAPNSGEVQFNNAAKASTTSLVFHIEDALDGSDFSSYLDLVRGSVHIFMRGDSTVGASVLYRITGTPLVDATTVTVPVASEEDHGGEFQNGELLYHTFLPVGTLTYAQPSVHNFSIDIPSRVDIGTNLNVAHTSTFSVTNRQNIQSISLMVVAGDNKVLTVPTSDGQHMETETLSGIDTSSQGAVDFNIRIVDTHGVSHDSNIQQVLVQNLLPQEQAHFGFVLSTEDETDIDFGTDDIEARDNFEGDWTVSGIPVDANLYRIYMAVPTAEGQVSQATQAGFNITNQFTNIPSVTIGGQTYNVFLMNVASAVNSNYNNAIINFS